MKRSKIVLLVLAFSITLIGCGNKKQIQECNNQITSINQMLSEGKIDLAEKQLDITMEEINKFNIKDSALQDKINKTQSDINREKEKIFNLQQIEETKNLISNGKLNEAKKNIELLDSKNLSDEKSKELLNQCKKMLHDKEESIKIQQQKAEEKRKKQEELNKQKQANKILDVNEIAELVRNKYGRDEENITWSFAENPYAHYLKEISTGDIYYYSYIIVNNAVGTPNFADVLINAKTKEFVHTSRFAYQENMDKFQILDEKPKQ